MTDEENKRCMGERILHTSICMFDCFTLMTFSSFKFLCFGHIFFQSHSVIASGRSVCFGFN